MSEFWDGGPIENWIKLESMEGLIEYVNRLRPSLGFEFSAEYELFIHMLVGNIAKDAHEFFPDPNSWDADYPENTTSLRLFFIGYLGFTSQNLPERGYYQSIRNIANFLVKELEVNWNAEEAEKVARILRNIRDEGNDDIARIHNDSIDNLVNAIDPHIKNRSHRFMNGETMEEISNSVV